MRTTVITGATRLLGALLRRFSRVAAAQAPLNPSRLLLLKSCCLGDLLQTTPLLATLRRAYPRAEITVAVGAWSRPMIETNQHVDSVLTIPDRWTLGSIIAVARELRRRSFDVVFVPERTPIPGLVTLLAGIPTRVGLDSRGRGFAYTHPVPVPQTVIHEADLYLLLARAVGLTPTERRLWFFPTDRDRQDASALLADIPGDGPLILLHPGGGSNPGMVLHRKRWLPDRWAQVADAFHHDRQARIVIVGSAAEHDVAAAVAAHMRAPATVLAKQWRWGLLAAVIEQAALFLGHDTGMTLLANSVGVPLVAVFGPSDPQTYGPYGPRGRYVWRPTPQSPCFFEGAAPADCPCAGQCMRNVEPAHVLKLVDQLLPSPGARKPI